eukprot:gene29913-biopygen11666
MSGIRVEDIDDEHGQHNIPPSVWGPPLWKSIHYVALGYPADPTPEERRVYKTFFDQILEHLIPCQVCSENYHRHLVELRGSAPQPRQFFGMLIQHNMMAMHKKAYEGVLGIDNNRCRRDPVM